MKNRIRPKHAWYMKNKERVKRACALYRKQLKADPIAWAGFLAKARAYKAKRKAIRLKIVSNGGYL